MIPMRVLLLLCLAAALPALAQAPPRPGALGSAKEDDPTPPRPARAGPDAALLRAVLWAFEPLPAEVRVLAVEDLGLLGDPRALNPLAQLAVDPNPSIARAAVRAVGLFTTPRAEEILCNVVRHPTLPEPLKLLALELVPYQNTDSALRFVRLVAGTNAFPLNLQNQARREVGELPPHRGVLQ